MKIHRSRMQISSTPTPLICLMLIAGVSTWACSTSGSSTSTSTKETSISGSQRIEPEEPEDEPGELELLEARQVTGADIETAGAAEGGSPVRIVVKDQEPRDPGVEVMAPVFPPWHEPRDRYMRFRETWRKQNPDGENEPKEEFGNLVREAGGEQAWEATVRGYWIGGVNEELLFAHEERFGPWQFIERFFIDDQHVDLVLYQRARPADEPVEGHEDSHQYTAVAFDASGAQARPLWALDLSALYPSVLEMDDIQIDPHGKLLANVNYSSYAKDVDGQTAWLYRVDPSTAQAMWKSEPLTSRNEFFVYEDDYVLAGYGFTDEEDTLYALDLETGARLDELDVPSMPERLKRIYSADGSPIRYKTKSGRDEGDSSVVLELESGGVLLVTYDAALALALEEEQKK